MPADNILLAIPFDGIIPKGTVEFRSAFKQLSLIEKDAVADIIIDYEIAGVKVDKKNKIIENIIDKKILSEMPNGKYTIRPSILAGFDTYLGKIAQFRATEMSRVHKNPIMKAIKSG